MANTRNPSEEVNPRHMRERPQKTSSHEPGALDKRVLTDRLSTYRRVLTRNRELMGDLQRAASYARSHYGAAPENLKLALKDSRAFHRETLESIRLVEAEMKMGEEE